MRITLLPQDKPAVLCVVFTTLSVLLLIIFFGIDALFEFETSDAFFDILALAIPLLLVWVSACIGLVFGIIAIMPKKHLSVIMLLCMLLSAFFVYYGILEVLYPH